MISQYIFLFVMSMSMPSVHSDSATLPGSAAQAAAAAAVCGPSESRFPEDYGPAAADSFHSAITAPSPRAAQTCSSPALHTQPAGHNLPLHYQLTPLLPQQCQSPACPAHCHQSSNTPNSECSDTQQSLHHRRITSVI